MLVILRPARAEWPGASVTVVVSWPDSRSAAGPSWVPSSLVTAETQGKPFNVHGVEEVLVKVMSAKREPAAPCSLDNPISSCRVAHAPFLRALAFHH